ncbi:MAG: hypothetical protein Q4E24_07880 [bacterium]|nr:hypothetical protein [bacterium]
MNRKKKWILSAAAGILIAAAVLCVSYIRQQGLNINETKKDDASAVSIIGGADGPTSIFLAGKLGKSAENLESENLESGNLTKPPLLCLKDVLSSTDDKFETASGNYSWYYSTGKKDEIAGGIACGLAPLEEAKEKERLKLVQYNNLDFASYIVSMTEKPDNIVVTEYAVTDLGNTDAEALSSEAYDEVLVVHIKPERVYEITAGWAEEKMNERGFYGSASYVVVTE